jgi:uncharacterized repeat protein (TIGR03803 family)
MDGNDSPRLCWRADGEIPQGGVTQDTDGNLYGTTALGGNGGGGTVYRLTQTPNGWEKTVLHSFVIVGNNPDGAYPTESLTFDEAGNLYGTTLECGSEECGCGVVYRLSPRPDGSWSSPLLIDPAGHIYGTAMTGLGDNGLVFEIK